MQIYSGNVLLQRTLCVQMMEKLSNFFIPNQLLSAKIMRHQLYQAIQNIYVQLSAIEVYRQKGI
jgi:hypothetical protein